MYQLTYVATERLAIIRFSGKMKGAEAQVATVEAAQRSVGQLRKVFWDFRDVTQADLTDSDGALVKLNASRIAATGVDLTQLEVVFVTTPGNSAVNDVIYERLRLGNVHTSQVGVTLTEIAERPVRGALLALGLPTDFELPY